MGLPDTRTRLVHERRTQCYLSSEEVLAAIQDAALRKAGLAFDAATMDCSAAYALCGKDIPYGEQHYIHASVTLVERLEQDDAHPSRIIDEPGDAA